MYIYIYIYIYIMGMLLRWHPSNQGRCSDTLLDVTPRPLEAAVLLPSSALPLLFQAGRTMTEEREIPYKGKSLMKGNPF